MTSLSQEQETDESLMVLIQKKDHQAFTLIVERHTQRFYATAFRMLGRAEIAEDIVQDAFLKLWKTPSLWQEGKGAKFTTWFYRIVVNMSIDHMRKSKGMVLTDITDHIAGGQKAQDKELVDKQKQESLENAIQALPKNQKTALNLCFYEGVSNKDAADIMGIGVKALESLLMRAKGNVKDSLIRSGLLEQKEAV